jgi:putative acetyltransferase
MRIRAEVPRDYPSVYQINAAAFGVETEAKLIGAPMAVAPPRQRSGIGSALVKAGLAHCKELGAVAVVVLGHPEFYPKFGFSPAARFGLKCEYDVPAEAFMAIELRAGILRGASGTVKYHAAFSQL